MIVARVRRTLEERKLTRPGEHVVVACSGGPDSVAMAHALDRLAGPLGLTLIVAAVDHGLRPESAREVAAVGELARALGLPFQALRVDVVERGAGLQAAARGARYDALLGLAREIGASRVAVGHTKNDQAETVLDRILRGASIRGLAGIAPRRADGVVRPLIDCERAEVLAHNRHHALPSFTDPSNSDQRFGRVRIRGMVLPALASEDPAIVAHLASLADDARAARQVLAQAERRLLAQADAAGGLALPALRTAPEATRRGTIGRWCRQQTGIRLGRSHLVAVDRLVTTGMGEVLIGRGWALSRQEDMLVLQPATGRK